MSNNTNNLYDLEQLMIEHGICIRTIPKKIRSIVEVSHLNDPEFSKSNITKIKITYLEEFKREMLIVERVPEHAGMFLIESNFNTLSSIKFSGVSYYNSLDEVIIAIKKMYSK